MPCAACGHDIQLDRPCENCGFTGWYGQTPVFARDPNYLPLTKEAALVAAHNAEQMIIAQERRETIH